jgi:hypothetical protein
MVAMLVLGREFGHRLRATITATVSLGVFLTWRLCVTC